MTEFVVAVVIYGALVGALVGLSPVIARDLRVDPQEMRTAILQGAIAFPLVVAAMGGLLVIAWAV